MAYYLSKYVGKYRLKAEIDLRTNDFCRDKRGNLNNNDDIYITCAQGVRVYYYGHNVLEVYVPSTGKGRNIVRQICYENGIGNVKKEENKTDRDGKEIVKISYKEPSTFDDLTSKLKKKDTLIFDVFTTDEEVTFKIKDDDFEKIVHILKPQESGAKISPFSTKNLPKDKGFSIPDDEMAKYKKITENVGKENALKLAQVIRTFTKDIVLEDGTDVKKDMKMKGLTGKEYIYAINKWDEFLKFLSKESKNL